MQNYKTNVNYWSGKALALFIYIDLVLKWLNIHFSMLEYNVFYVVGMSRKFQIITTNNSFNHVNTSMSEKLTNKTLNKL